MHIPAADALIRALVLVAVLGVAVAEAQNPWGPVGGPAARPAPDAPTQAPAPPPAPTLSEGGKTPGFMRPFVDRIAAAQRTLNRTISREMREISQSGSARALLVVTGVAFVYGVLHAAGPGHGKLVVSSFFLARRARIGAGIAVGTAISFLQAITSIVLVCALGALLGQHGFDVLGRSVWIEAASYALIVAIGVVMAFTAFRGHDHEHRHGAGRVGLGMIVAAGVTPCASALITMLFALTNGVLLVGIGATLVMAVGMSITTSLVGVLTILGRRTFMVALPGSPTLRDRVSMGLGVAGGIVIAVVGALLLAGAWARLG
jgi:ABC-type nickel/cobalt efflux system permease component RcnA